MKVKIAVIGFLVTDGYFQSKIRHLMQERDLRTGNTTELHFIDAPIDGYQLLNLTELKEKITAHGNPGPAAQPAC